MNSLSEWVGAQTLEKEDGEGRDCCKEHEASSAWADPCMPCRAGHGKDIGLLLKETGAIDKK